MAEVLEPAGDELLPYDNDSAFPGYWNRILSTLREFASHPRLASMRIANAKKGKDGLTFLLAVVWPINAVTELSKLAALHSPWVRQKFFPHNDLTNVNWLSTSLSVLFFPIGTWIGFWVVNAVVHGALWIWRGLHEDLGVLQTARSFGFGLAFITAVSAPISLVITVIAPEKGVPYFGLLELTLSVALLSYLLSKSHRTELWKGVAAVLSPTLLLLFLLAGFSLRNLGKLLLR
jgi:hypothetical protein